MNKFRRELMWAALGLLVVLTFLSIYGAFIGADRAKMFFNSTPAVVFWVLLALALIAGFVAFRRLTRVPGLLLMHAGCVLILIGAALGSEIGYKITGNDKIIEGYMQIFEGQSTNQVRTEEKLPLFSVGIQFAGSLDERRIPQNLRQEFVKQQAALSEAARVFVSQPGGVWIIAEDDGQYYIRREGSKLKVYDFIREMRELPFSVRLNDFRLEYYQPKVEYLRVETNKGVRQVVAEVGRQLDLGPEFGTARIVRKYQNLKISIEGGETTYYEDPNPGSNPALEVEITKPDGESETRYVFSLHPGFTHSDSGPRLVYDKPRGGAIRDYISELEVIDKQDTVLAQKDIEVNHPLHYGGYHFYQSSYDAQAGRYTVLQVVSDTGAKIVFAGYWMLCLGAFWHMWLRRLLKNIRGKK
jgi:hypothetical protein